MRLWNSSPAFQFASCTTTVVDKQICYCINAFSHTGLYTFTFSIWILSLLTSDTFMRVYACVSCERLVYHYLARSLHSTGTKTHVIYTRLNPGDKSHSCTHLLPQSANTHTYTHTHTYIVSMLWSVMDLWKNTEDGGWVWWQWRYCDSLHPRAAFSHFHIITPKINVSAAWKWFDHSTRVTRTRMLYFSPLFF